MYVLFVCLSVSLSVLSLNSFIVLILKWDNVVNNGKKYKILSAIKTYPKFKDLYK
jgi:hypothetical protein